MPRTAAAGKELSTSIDRSRTIDGNRGSDVARRSSLDRRGRSKRVGVELERPERARRAGKPRASSDRRVGSGRCTPIPRRPTRDFAGRPPRGTARPPARSRRSTPKRAADRLDDALHVEEISRAARRPTSAAGAPLRSRRRPPRATSPARGEARAGLEQPHVVRARRRRLCAAASTSPGSSDGRSTANFSDSGLAT